MEDCKLKNVTKMKIENTLLILKAKTTLEQLAFSNFQNIVNPKPAKICRLNSDIEVYNEIYTDHEATEV